MEPVIITVQEGLMACTLTLFALAVEPVQFANVMMQFLAHMERYMLATGRQRVLRAHSMQHTCTQ